MHQNATWANAGKSSALSIVQPGADDVPDVNPKAKQNQSSITNPWLPSQRLCVDGIIPYVLPDSDLGSENRCTILGMNLKLHPHGPPSLWWAYIRYGRLGARHSQSCSHILLCLGRGNKYTIARRSSELPLISAMYTNELEKHNHEISRYTQRPP